MKKNVFFILCICFFIYCLLRYPQAMLSASADSVVLWFNQVLPSLFPFMVASGLLLRMGAAEAMGNCLRPFMKPLFGLPGIASFPFFLGLFSGYPMGAKITATLYEEKKITLTQAEHILSFCNNPGPLYLVGTIGAAFFHAPHWGYLFLFCCFFSALVTGILSRWFYPYNPREELISVKKNPPSSITESLPKTIADSMDTITQIGGYIILFGVAVEALQQTGILSFVGKALSFLSFSEQFFSGILGGFLEMTNGAFLLSTAPDSLPARLTASCMLVAFGGLSILCQTFGILKNVPIKKSRYIVAKICNSLFSGIFFYFLAPIFEKYVQKTVPTLALTAETGFFTSFSYVHCNLLFLFLAIAYGLRQKH